MEAGKIAWQSFLCCRQHGVLRKLKNPGGQRREIEVARSATWCRRGRGQNHVGPCGLGFSAFLFNKRRWKKYNVSSPSPPAFNLSQHLSRPHGVQPTRLLHPWDFPGKSTGVGCHCLLRSSRELSKKSTNGMEGNWSIVNWRVTNRKRSRWAGHLGKW